MSTDDEIGGRTSADDKIIVTIEQGNGRHVAHWHVRPERIDGQPDQRRYVCSGPAYGFDGFAFNDEANMDPDALAIMAMLGPGLTGDELLAKYADHFTRSPARPPATHTLYLTGQGVGTGTSPVVLTHEGRCSCGQWSATSPEQEWVREYWRQHIEELREPGDAVA